MAEPIKHISKVEIKGLWGKFDFEWNLQSDVNVLSGINGSGKSTILRCISMIKNIEILNDKWGYIDAVGKTIDSATIYFNDREYFIFKFYKKSSNSNDFIGYNKDDDGIVRYSGPRNHIYITGSISLYAIESFFRIDVINTFDNEMLDLETAKKLSDDNVQSELDFQVYNLQKKYLDFQLNVGKRVFEAIRRNNSNREVVAIQDSKDRFLEIIDFLFLNTGKKINREDNEISFLSGEQRISPYQLSSGEKQMLIILLTVLIQDNKPAILFLDEPEISLHFDWQKKLIGYIRELNPNVQVILATHSPAVIMEGWMDKVANMSDLIKPAQKEAHVG